jgi:hypothetical protein
MPKAFRRLSAGLSQSSLFRAGSRFLSAAIAVNLMSDKGRTSTLCLLVRPSWKNNTTPILFGARVELTLCERANDNA